MTNVPRHRRSPLISLLIFVVILAAVLLLIAVLRFDIGAYRQELAAQLEKVLKQPVQLGDAELNFKGGIAFDFRNLRIGKDDNFRLHVPRLSTTLEPLGLLRGKITIKQILLDSPDLKLKRPLPMAQSTLNLDRLGLKTLQVREGKLTIAPADSTQATTRIDHLNLILHGLGQGRVSQLATTARVIQGTQLSELKLFLKLTRQRAGQDWRQGSLRGNLSLSNLRPFLPDGQNPAWLRGPIDLSLGVEGIPADGVAINAVLSDNQDEPLNFTLAANWQSSALQDQLSHVRLGLDEIPLSGLIKLNRQEKEPRLSGHLSLADTSIEPLLKGFGLSSMGVSGQIDQLLISIDGPLHPTPESSFSPLDRASLSLKNLSYTEGKARLENLNLTLEMTDNELRLNGGRGTVNGLPFTFSAASGPLTQRPLELTFTLQSDLDLERLQQQSTSPFLSRQRVAGIAPLKFQAGGPVTNLATHLEIDLTNTQLELGKLLTKEPGTPGRIDLAGRLNATTLALEHLQIDLDQAEITAAGRLDKGEQGWHGELSFAPLRLEKLQSSSPIFEHFKINGQAGGQLVLTPGDWRAQIGLSAAGAHFTPLIADLKGVEATLSVDRNGIDLGQATARLGQSPIRVSGGLTGWRAALITLHVTGKEVRAQDLIFTNRQMKLQDLDGRLLINGGGITFDPVLVSVENRTRVSVSGQLRDYHNPQTSLEIESEDADILDVIRLFTGPHKLPQTAHKPSDASVVIKARVKKGQLGSFFFEDATGTITDRHNIFTLDPLQFKLGEGQSFGRVEIERDRNNLLKISGHAQNCDADRVYEMLFEKKGIFRGNLSGDFYLEGEGIGERFWQTAHGGGHLRIRDGAMRKLQGFAQIFSLLNVSQLFKFRLPDMDQEGLPLSLLEGSGRMTDGILYFDDLKITSPAINISAVGQINTLDKTIDSTLGIKPLRTVDIILSNVPLFGWVLTGDEEALITALFTLKGPIEDPSVAAAPASSVAKTALGIIGRTLGLPFRMLKKTGEFLTTPPQPEEATPEQAPKNQAD